MITRFGFPIILISDRGTLFINKTIETPMKEYMVDHHKSSSYHPQANGAIKSLKKALTRGLTKICNLDKNDWDDKILTFFCTYRIAYKISNGKTPFQMVYG